ncbi:sigma-70 family RNA polymerase sigma factor [Frigoriglobus tundricola]|uniref:Uncharacterized protein n=1 Tax=Frigoriglobus tundricola TaxID=2774151 RepID=A0A6M5YQX2_9BACT|nr:sigma-70 family RNA polymerase sigma factor [Frigoriglobus tundricola]QJW95820.1 hypothetical protein FTUN_3374 [Frigoriglobus tundricola]
MIRKHIQNLRTALLIPDGVEATDEQLLADLFRDPAGPAFALAVRRHGGMVWGVCRRILRNYHDAEQAFQATFLALFERVRARAAVAQLGGWLHEVARCIAKNLSREVWRRTERDRRAGEHAAPGSTSRSGGGLEPLLDTELRGLLDDELSRLPDRYRVVLLLCDLDGATRSEAARRLGVREGTVAGRLTRGRALLAKRLARRGVTAPTVTLAVGIAPQGASASAPTSLVGSTVRAVRRGAAGRTADAISSEVAALTEGTVKAMFLSKCRSVAVVVLVVVGLGGGVIGAAASATTGPGGADRGAGPVRSAAARRQAKGPGEPAPRRPVPVRDLKVRDPLEGHTDSVTAVAFSPDGKTLASASRDATIKLWDVATGKERTALTGHTGSVVAVAFAPDGKTVASAGADKEIRLWDVATGKCTRTLSGHTEPVTSVAFGPNGKALASGSDDRTVRLWDPASGKATATLEGHPAGVECVAFAPDGKTVAAGGGKGTIQFWNVATGKGTMTVTDGECSVRSLAYSPDGKTVASGHARGTDALKLWEAATGKNVAVLDGHTSTAFLSYTPSGANLITVSGDMTLVCWNVATGRGDVSFRDVDSGTSVTVSPDGKHVATGGTFDKAVKVWDVEYADPPKK